MLQNLANKPTYAKESYMIPTNPFVTANKQRINKFLNDLCEVSDFYESLEMDQYMALSRKDIYINITPNELYSTQALINQHLHRLAPDETHHLHILLQDLGSTPKPVPRQMNKPIKLPLYSRWETSPLLASQQAGSLYEEQSPENDLTICFSENNITQNDIMYMETKSMFVQIMRSMPHTIKLSAAALPSSSSLDLIRVAEAAGTAKDPLLANKGRKVQAMLQDLEEAGIVRRDNHYELLVQEIQQELNHLGDLKDRVVLEIKSLEQVFKTIQDHNDYLQSQLEAYKAYLQNVRMQSSGSMDGGNGRRKSSLAAAVGFTQAGPAHISTVQQQPQPLQDQTPPINHSSNISVHTTASAGNVNSSGGSSTSSSVIKKKPTGPLKFSHQQLEKEGIIVQSEVPDNRRANIYLMIQSPIAGAFVISIHYKGREKPILEIDLKLDDLLEKVRKTSFRQRFF
jgi:Ras GTPase-activating-like protein IQGAP2/3